MEEIMGIGSTLLSFFNWTRGKKRNEDLFLDSSDPLQLKEKFRKILPSGNLEKFQNYKILRRIGRGSMGIVYEALHLPSKQKVALKTISRQIIQDEKVLNRFRQEISVHKTINHPNIVKLCGLGTHNKGVFVIMEYVDGHSLEDYVAMRKKLDALEALEFAIQILHGLHFAHRQKIIHRDLKPANILIERSTRRVKIADFGLAKFTDRREMQVSTTGEVLGTPAYMSPEQILHSKKVDIRADIYSLGCILYYMLLGKRPYSHIKDPSQLVNRKFDTCSKSAKSLAAQVPKPLRKIVAKAIDGRVKKRFSSPKSFLKILQAKFYELEKEREEREKIEIKKSRRFMGVGMESREILLSHLPKAEENMEGTFMSSISIKTQDPILSTFQEEMKQIENSPVETILTSLKKGDLSERELLDSTQVTTKGSPLKNVEKLILPQLKSKDMLRALSKALLEKDLEAKEKIILTDLKHALLLRGKAISRQSNILEIINEGQSYLKKELKKMGSITESSRMNSKIREYFTHLIECRLREHEEIFRKGLTACQNSQQMESFLENYPLNSLSIIKKYKFLHIISKVKKIKKDWDKNPKKLTVFLNKHLGRGEVSIRTTFEKLEVNDRSYVILDMIMKEKHLESLLHSLKTYDGKKEIAQTTNQIYHLIKAFLEPSNKSSIGQFKVALNFIPFNLRNKICVLIRRRIGKELMQKVHKILTSEEKANKRVKAFVEILRNPKYKYSSLTLFGFTTDELYEKIQQVRYQNQSIRQVFSGKKIPSDFRVLLEEDREIEKASRSRNLENCLEKLQQLKARLKGRKPLPLMTNLIKIFKYYGQVNFAENQSSITGYQLAQNIIAFYRNPARETITLPLELKKEVYCDLKTMIDEYRAKQLRKMKKK